MFSIEEYHVEMSPVKMFLDDIYNLQQLYVHRM